MKTIKRHLRKSAFGGAWLTIGFGLDNYICASAAAALLPESCGWARAEITLSPIEHPGAIRIEPSGVSFHRYHPDGSPEYWDAAPPPSEPSIPPAIGVYLHHAFARDLYEASGRDESIPVYLTAKELH